MTAATSSGSSGWPWQSTVEPGRLQQDPRVHSSWIGAGGELALRGRGRRARGPRRAGARRPWPPSTTLVQPDADVAKALQDLGHDPQGAQGVAKAGVLRAVIRAVGGAQLADAPQPLKLRRIDQLQKERLAQGDEVVNRIAIRLLAPMVCHQLTLPALVPRDVKSRTCRVTVLTSLRQRVKAARHPEDVARDIAKPRRRRETPPLWPRRPRCRSGPAGSSLGAPPAPRVETRRSSPCRSPPGPPR